MLVVALAGCSESGTRRDPGRSSSLAGMSPAEIISRAIKATDALATVRSRTTIDTDTRHMVFDLRRAADGTCFGELTFGTQTLTVILTEDHAFVRASEAYWRAFNGQLRGDDFGLRMAEQPSRWARLQTVDAYRPYCDPSDLAENSMLVPTLFDDGRTGAAHKDSDGRTVVEVTAGHGSPVATVASGRPSYLLEFRVETTRTTQVTVFSEFGEPAEVEVPDEGQFVPYDDLVVLL
jgi:hypothetical protein